MFETLRPNGLTDSDPLSLEAGLAANGAAPLELAIAPIFLQLLDADVPAPATQRRTTDFSMQIRVFY